MTLPDCPHCKSPALEAVGVESRGVRVCVCECCARGCRVNTTGAVVHVPSKLDTGGNVIYPDP